MRRLLFSLILLLAPVTLSAQDSTKAQLMVADSQNAHEMATVALEAVQCLLSDAFPQTCMMQFEPRYLSLGRQHQIIHQKLSQLAERKRS